MADHTQQVVVVKLLEQKFQNQRGGGPTTKLDQALTFKTGLGGLLRMAGEVAQVQVPVAAAVVKNHLYAFLQVVDLLLL